MGVKVKFEKRPEGGFAIVFEEDGSGDLNRVMGDLCEKHKGEFDDVPTFIFSYDLTSFHIFYQYHIPSRDFHILPFAVISPSCFAYCNTSF